MDGLQFRSIMSLSDVAHWIALRKVKKAEEDDKRRAINRIALEIENKKPVTPKKRPEWSALRSDYICGACGEAIGSGDKFCAQCGRAINW